MLCGAGLAYALPWMVNAGFIVREDETLVVDTGANALAAATIHGYATAVRPENRLRVVNTEKHFDHIGGNGFFHELAVPIHGHSGIARTSAVFADERSGVHPAFHYGTPLVNPGATLPAVFELGSCRVEVLLTPGHTPTNISLYVPEEGVVYCGDCLTVCTRPTSTRRTALRIGKSGSRPWIGFRLSRRKPSCAAMALWCAARMWPRPSRGYARRSISESRRPWRLQPPNPTTSIRSSRPCASAPWNRTSSGFHSSGTRWAESTTRRRR